MVTDLTIKVPVRGVPNEGANLEYPISSSLFSYRHEKSVLKLRHWIKVSRTEFQAHGQVQPSRGVPQCSGLPLSEVSALTIPVALLLLSRKTRIRYSLRDLTSRKLSLPNFCICLLPCKPSSSFLDGGQKGAQWGLCSRMRIRWWRLRRHVKPRDGEQKHLYVTLLS